MKYSGLMIPVDNAYQFIAGQFMGTNNYDFDKSEVIAPLETLKVMPQK